MRSLWNDIALLWYEYKRQRALHPKWRRLELVRAGLESLDKVPLPLGVEWLDDKLVELDRFGGAPKE